MKVQIKLNNKIIEGEDATNSKIDLNFSNYKPLKIYLSGKISGLVIEDAFDKFEWYENYLSQKFTVINPMKLKPAFGLHYWPFYMLRDLWELHRCDAIFLLPDWQDSKCAKIEKRFAEWCWIEVVYIDGKK